MKSAALDVLHNTVEDLKNELAGFKKTMAGVCRKYDDNFRRNGASARHLHEGWLSHEAAIEKINERCTCGVDSEDEFETVETVSSPSPIGTPVLPEPVPLQVMLSFHVRQVTWARFVQPIDLSFNRCVFFRKRSRCPQAQRLPQYVAIRGLCLLILLSAGVWLRSLQRAESRSPTEELRSDLDEIVQPLRLPSCLLETNAIRRPEPPTIAEAMERLPIPAVRVQGESSPNLAEIVCRVLANDSRGIIGGHLSVDSSQLGYRIGIEVRVSSEVGNEILGRLQESLEDSV